MNIKRFYFPIAILFCIVIATIAINFYKPPSPTAVAGPILNLVCKSSVDNAKKPLEQQIKKLQGDLKMLDTNYKNCGLTNESISKNNKENYDKLLNEYNGMLAKNSEIEKENSTLYSENSTLSSNLNTCQPRLESKIEEADESYEFNKKLTADKIRLSDENDKLKSDNIGYQRKIVDLNTLLTNSATIQGDCKRSIEFRDSQITELKSNYDTCIADKTKLQTNYGTCESDKTRIQSNYDTCISDKNRLNSEFTTVQNKLINEKADLQTQYNNDKATCTSQKAELQTKYDNADSFAKQFNEANCELRSAYRANVYDRGMYNRAKCAGTENCSSLFPRNADGSCQRIGPGVIYP